MKRQQEVWKWRRSLVRMGTLNIGTKGRDSKGKRAGRYDGAKER